MHTIAHESLARLACLAAVQLETFRQSQPTSLNDVEAFFLTVTQDMSIDKSTTPQDWLALVNPVTAFAIKDSITAIENKNLIKDIEELIAMIKDRLTDPLYNIIERYKIDKELKGLDDTINATISLCISISDSYTFTTNSDNTDHHPYR